MAYLIACFKRILDTESLCHKLHCADLCAPRYNLQAYDCFVADPAKVVDYAVAYVDSETQASLILNSDSKLQPMCAALYIPKKQISNAEADPSCQCAKMCSSVLHSFITIAAAAAQPWAMHSNW